MPSTDVEPDYMAPSISSPVPHLCLDPAPRSYHHVTSLTMRVHSVQHRREETGLMPGYLGLNLNSPAD